MRFIKGTNKTKVRSKKNKKQTKIRLLQLHECYEYIFTLSIWWNRIAVCLYFTFNYWRLLEKMSELSESIFWATYVSSKYEKQEIIGYAHRWTWKCFSIILTDCHQFELGFFVLSYHLFVCCTGNQNFSIEYIKFIHEKFPR